MSILRLKDDINNFVMNNVKRKMTEILKAKLTNPINNAKLEPNFESFLEKQFNDNFITDAKAAYITTAEIEKLLNQSTSRGGTKKKTRKRTLSRPRRATLGKNKGGAKKVRTFRMSGGVGNEENVQLEAIHPYQYPNYSLREYEYIIKKSNEYIKRQQENMKKFKEKLLEKAKEPLKNLLMCVLEEHFANVLTRDFKENLNNAVVISQNKASEKIKDAVDNVKLYKTIWETKKTIDSNNSEDSKECINDSLQNIVNEYKEKLKNPIPLVN
jgi:hypothetical protein